MKRIIPPGDRPFNSYAMADYYAKVAYWYKTEWVALLVRARMAHIGEELRVWNCLDQWGVWKERGIVMKAVANAENA